MKYYKYILVVLISILFLPLTGQAYEYINSKNKSNVERYRTDIYHLREMYEDFIVEEGETEESNSCTTVGTIYKECSGITVEGYGTYSLEEYVAGVLAGDEGWSQYLDNPTLRYFIPAMVRTVGLTSSNNCTTSISGTTSVQIFQGDTKSYIDVANESAGVVLVDNTKNPFTPGYSVTGLADCESISDGMCHITRYHKWDYKETYESIYPTSSILTSGSISVHHVGANPNDIEYKAKELNYSAEQLAKYVFGEDTEYAQLESDGYSSDNENTKKSKSFTCEGTDDGLSVASASGFKKRTSQPKSDNKHYFSNENASYAGGFVGQCTWYAFGRANEILTNAKSKLKWTIASDAGQWYSANKSQGTKGFKSTTDVNKPKVGAIIVWQDVNGVSSDCKGCGHVAVVETVNSNKTIDITEANIGSVKSSSNPYGWQYVSNLSFAEVSNRWGYSFAGYIYTVE